MASALKPVGTMDNKKTVFLTSPVQLLNSSTPSSSTRQSKNKVASSSFFFVKDVKKSVYLFFFFPFSSVIRYTRLSAQMCWDDVATCC